MSNDYSATSAWVIAESRLAALLPQEWEEFCQARAAACPEAGDYERWVHAMDADDPSSAFEAVDDQLQEQQQEWLNRAYVQLQQAFTQKTQVDDSELELAIAYHDAEAEGSRYDDVDGIFWVVRGMVMMTPAGEQAAKLLDVSLQFYVLFG